MKLVLQTIKDVNQALVDDGLVDCDKVRLPRKTYVQPTLILHG